MWTVQFCSGFDVPYLCIYKPCDSICRAEVSGSNLAFKWLTWYRVFCMTFTLFWLATLIAIRLSNKAYSVAVITLLAVNHKGGFTDRQMWREMTLVLTLTSVPSLRGVGVSCGPTHVILWLQKDKWPNALTKAHGNRDFLCNLSCHDRGDIYSDFVS